MLYELRITARGGGANLRELERRYAESGAAGGIFQTEVGETGQSVIIWPRLETFGEGRSSPGKVVRTRGGWLGTHTASTRWSCSGSRRS